MSSLIPQCAACGEVLICQECALDSDRPPQPTRDEIIEALRNVVTHLEWIKIHVRRAPRMDEPNTGALAAAQAVLDRLDGRKT